MALAALILFGLGAAGANRAGGGVGGSVGPGAAAGCGQTVAEVIDPDAIVSTDDRSNTTLWTPDKMKDVTAAYLRARAMTGMNPLDNSYRRRDIYKCGIKDPAPPKGRTLTQEYQFLVEYNLSESHVSHKKLTLDWTAITNITKRIPTDVLDRFEVVARQDPVEPVQVSNRTSHPPRGAKAWKGSGIYVLHSRPGGKGYSHRLICIREDDTLVALAYFPASEAGMKAEVRLLDSMQGRKFVKEAELLDEIKKVVRAWSPAPPPSPPPSPPHQPAAP